MRGSNWESSNRPGFRRKTSHVNSPQVAESQGKPTIQRELGMHGRLFPESRTPGSSADFFPDIANAVIGGFGNATACAGRHLHHTHAAIKVVGQRTPDLLKFFRVLRRYDSQTDAGGKHPRRITLLQK